jgi:hypothetical protein
MKITKILLPLLIVALAFFAIAVYATPMSMFVWTDTVEECEIEARTHILTEMNDNAKYDYNKQIKIYTREGHSGIECEVETKSRSNDYMAELEKHVQWSEELGICPEGIINRLELGACSPDYNSQNIPTRTETTDNLSFWQQLLHFWGLK